jgi:fructose-1,6-bisphosphatase I
MKDKGVTLAQFILEQQGPSRESYEFSMLMSQVSLAAKLIVREIGRAGLGDILGLTGTINVQGEAVQKLDQFANDTFVQVLQKSGLVCMVASEELEKPVQFEPTTSAQDGRGTPGNYVLLFDPLDGSSNINVNGTLGSIFSVYQAKTPGRPDPVNDILRRGTDQVAAGYVIYGPSTILVYTSGRGVHGFTLDPQLGEFLLSHPDIRIPGRGKTYSVNQGNYHDWMPEAQRYIDYLLEKDPKEGRPYSLRYVGTLVADLHRTLLTGGIFLYPASKKNPEGKLRLLYEASPMAFVMEGAGGKAIRGDERILDIQPSSLHQRVPLITGSPEDVEIATQFIVKGGK